MSDPEDAEQGSGVLAMSFGITFFIGFLLLAANVVALLYARSVVSAAAFDAARELSAAAGADGLLDRDELGAAEGRARQRVVDLLGSDATFRVIRVDAERAEVEVAEPAPRLLFGGGGLASDDGLVVRRATSRLEVLR